MSDDTPTQRFPEQSGDSTERIATGEVAGQLGEERQKSRGLLIGLIAAGVLLAIAIVVILFVVFGRQTGETDALPTPTTGITASPQPSASDTPSATPAASPTSTPSAVADPPPPSTALAIDSFTTPNKTVACNTQAPVPTNQYISFAWKTSNADTITLGTYDPYGDYQDMYYNLPPDGKSSDMGLEITYFCPEPSQKWRLTVTGNGQTVTKEITFTNVGDTQ